jgi:lipopolysaccharide export system protein LptA
MTCRIHVFILLLIVLGYFPLSAQKRLPPPPVDSIALPVKDSSQPLEIRHADRLIFLKKDSSDLQIAAGNVMLQQGTSLFYCDSCVLDQTGNLFEAWGSVRLIEKDTSDLRAKHLRYLIDRRIAYLDGDVRLNDGKGKLITPELEYDLNSDIGVYKKGGTVYNGKTTLNSREGFYYASLRDVYFIKDVSLKDPAYQIKTDTLLYNLDSKVTRFVSETEIRDSSGRIIETREGFYNMSTGKAEFGKRPVIRDGKTKITGEKIRFDDETGLSEAEGNVEIIDPAQGTKLLAGKVVRDKKKNTVLSTDHPVLIVEQDKDSVYITADTLFSGPLPANNNIVKAEAVSIDSNLRFFKAYNHVRIFTDSLQAACDSMYYSYEDSVFRLYQEPVIWSRGSQITGDTIILRTKNKKAEKLDVFENSLLVQKLDPEVYNQVKSIRMAAFLTDGGMDSLQAKGYAECIYFIQDDDSAYTGVNESNADRMDIYFQFGGIDRVVFRSEVTGTVWPMREKNPASMRLTGFRWLDDQRPTSRMAILKIKN